MIILGIDPGSRRVGYGAIDASGTQPKLLGAGILDLPRIDQGDALFEIKNKIAELIRTYKPELLAIERLYFSKNQKTALAVAEARGVILLTAREQNIRVAEYAPNEVKSGITGYGFADKAAVLKMVQILLGAKDLHLVDDASDALGVALLAASRARIDKQKHSPILLKKPKV